MFLLNIINYRVLYITELRILPVTYNHTNKNILIINFLSYNITHILLIKFK